jgi:hypothetical protein
MVTFVKTFCLRKDSMSVEEYNSGFFEPQRRKSNLNPGGSNDLNKLSGNFSFRPRSNRRNCFGSGAKEFYHSFILDVQASLLT